MIQWQEWFVTKLLTLKKILWSLRIKFQFNVYFLGDRSKNPFKVFTKKKIVADKGK
jgi:hypothetical protein